MGVTESPACPGKFETGVCRVLPSPLPENPEGHGGKGMTALSTLGLAAQAYSRNGKAIFPLHGIRSGRCTCGNSKCEKPGKHPRTEHGFKDASTDAAKIRQWWTRWPSANIGYAVTGHVVIDIDGEEGSRVLAELEGQFG